MAIEIVDLPINSMVIFHSYVTVYQRVTEVLCIFTQFAGPHDIPVLVASDSHPDAISPPNSVFFG